MSRVIYKKEFQKPRLVRVCGIKGLPLLNNRLVPHIISGLLLNSLELRPVHKSRVKKRISSTNERRIAFM